VRTSPGRGRPCLVRRQRQRLLHGRARSRRQPRDDPFLPGARENQRGAPALNERFRRLKTREPTWRALTVRSSEASASLVLRLLLIWHFKRQLKVNNLLCMEIGANVPFPPQQSIRPVA
jgi:hypothetical protein